MSAYVVDLNHIEYLIEAARGHALGSDGLTWIWNIDREAGTYEVAWDGTNNEGRATASGIYFCRMEAADYERTLKMVLLR